MTDEHAIQLLQMQAAQIALLLEIRDTMRLFVQQAVDEEPFAGCPHPEGSRVDLSTPGDRGHWVCSNCQFDSKAVA